jgi:hypothetical protein
VPVGVDDDVDNVRVDEPPELTDAGLKLALTPAGRPDAESATDCAAPDVTAVAMVEVVALPAVVDVDDGLADIEKSFVVGAVTMQSLARLLNSFCTV